MVKTIELSKLKRQKKSTLFNAAINECKKSDDNPVAVSARQIKEVKFGLHKGSDKTRQEEMIRENIRLKNKRRKEQIREKRRGEG